MSQCLVGKEAQHVSLSREGGVERESIADIKSFSTLAHEPCHFRVLCSRFAEGYEFSDPEFATGEGGKNKIHAKNLRGKCKRRALTSASERAFYPVRKVQARAAAEQLARKGRTGTRTYSCREAANSQELAATDPAA